MAKNVALSDKAYSELSKRKNEGESFSSVIIKLVHREEGKANWRDSFGALKNDKEAEKIFEKILKERHLQKPKKVLEW